MFLWTTVGVPHNEVIMRAGAEKCIRNDKVSLHGARAYKSSAVAVPYGLIYQALIWAFDELFTAVWIINVIAIAEWLYYEPPLQAIYFIKSPSSSQHTRTHTLTHSVALAPSVDSILWLHQEPKSSADSVYLIRSRVKLYEQFFPSPNMLCFLFCVCFDPGSCGGPLCGEARAGVALLCYFWRQRRLVALEMEWSVPDPNPGCLREFSSVMISVIMGSH